MVFLSSPFDPPILRGLKVHADNPFHFDFILDSGESDLKEEEFRVESKKLIKYFLTALTIPEEDLWVNLSPHEPDRIIPEEFGKTEMGRDLLAQDYLLKQLTASLIYPEGELGQKFWQKVRRQAFQQYGVMDIPVETFHKVWIVPDKAVVYENGATAFVVEGSLKVMLEEDYVAFEQSRKDSKLNVGGSELGVHSLNNQNVSNVEHPTLNSQRRRTNKFESEIIRQIILPEITKEINHGAQFTQLRQVYHSLILAFWFKRKLKKSILGQIYVNQNKIRGMNHDQEGMGEKIYQQYLEAYQKGVYNYIKEDYDLNRQQILPRKYFSGGMNFMWDDSISPIHDLGSVIAWMPGPNPLFHISSDLISPPMFANENFPFVDSQHSDSIADQAMIVSVNESTDLSSSKTWPALYSFPESASTGLMRRYSRYKYGAPDQGLAFQNELTRVILEKYGEEIRRNPSEWIISTTSYDLTIASFIPVVRRLAQELGVSYTNMRRVPRREGVQPAIVYSKLKTSDQRAALHARFDYYLETDQPMQGKKALLIDDLIVTGSALKNQVRVFANQYQIAVIDILSIVSLANIINGHDASFENKMNEYVVTTHGVQPLLDILNDPDTDINRHALTSLFRLDMNEFARILKKLTYSALAKLYIAAIEDYIIANDNTRMELLKNQVRIGLSHVQQKLSERLKRMDGRGLILLAGPMASDAMSQMEFFEDSLNSRTRVLSADYYPAAKAIFKYGIESHEHVRSYDVAQAWQDVDRLLRGEEIMVPPPYYDPRRPIRQMHLDERGILFLDGLYSTHPDFSDGSLREREAVKVFVDAPRQLRFMKRLLSQSSFQDPLQILRIWRNTLDVEGELLSIARNNADFIFVQPVSHQEVMRLARDTTEIRNALRGRVAQLSDEYQSSLVLGSILDDVEHFIARFETSPDVAMVVDEVSRPEGGVDFKADAMDLQIEGPGGNSFFHLNTACFDEDENTFCDEMVLEKIEYLRIFFDGFEEIKIVEINQLDQEAFITFLGGYDEFPKSPPSFPSRDPVDLLGNFSNRNKEFIRMSFSKEV